MRKASLRWFLFAASTLMLCAGNLSAGAFTVRLSTAGGEVMVPAEQSGKTIWIGLLQAAKGLGAQVSENRAGEYVFDLPAARAILNPHTSIYRVRAKTGSSRDRKWVHRGLPEKIRFRPDIGPLVPLEALPLILKKNLVYHLQKKTLAENVDDLIVSLLSNQRRVPARHKEVNRRTWIALDDLANALGAVVYSSQVERYNLVMPDFTVAELRVKDPWTYKRQEKFRLLEDPPLLFGGRPHLSLRAARALFETDLRWDAKTNQLLVPTLYSRAGQVPAAAKEPLTYAGDRPKPFRLTLDEISAHYQTPGPTYAAAHEDLYESVRDFSTREVIDPGTSGLERVSNETSLSAEGTLARRPFSATGRFEKLGTRSSLASGGFEWGYPGLRLAGGRDSVKVADFGGQVDFVDHVSLSASSDRLGEGDADAALGVRVLGGEHLFQAFVSTTFFSQVLVYRQRVAQGTVETLWRPRPGQSLTAVLDQYHFENRVREITADFNFFDQLFGEDLGLFDEEEASPELGAIILSRSHGTTVLDLGYEWTNLLSLNGAFGLSYFKDAAAGRRWVLDDDRRVALRLGGKTSSLDASHERAGPRYRSIGDPLRYQARNISRLAPYLTLAKPWRVYGEFRREDVGERPGADTPAYRSDYAALTNTLTFPRFNLRALASKYDNDLSGKRWLGSGDLSIFIGRDSIDVGGEGAIQYFTDGRIFRQSYAGRAAFHLLRPEWKVAVGEELRRNHYRLFDRTRWESLSQLSWQTGKWKLFAQYQLEPKDFRLSPSIHTGSLRLGRVMEKQKILNIFFSATGERPGLADPEVWRAGVEFINDYF